MTKKAYSYDEKGFFVRSIHGKVLPYPAGRAGTSRLITHQGDIIRRGLRGFIREIRAIRA